MSSPLHIGLVALEGAGWMGGVAYIRNLAKAIRLADPNARVSIVCAEPLRTFWQHDSPLISVPVDQPRGPRRFLPPYVPKVRDILRANAVDFLYPLTYENQHTLGIQLPVARQLDGCCWAGWVPDFQHRYLPHFFSKQEIDWRERTIAILAREAPRLILSSESAKTDFARFYPASADKSEVLHFATAPEDDWYDRTVELSCVKDSERFLLISNQFWAHKNHLLVFEALHLLGQKGVHPKVVCTGNLEDSRDGSYAIEVRDTLRDYGFSEQVKLLGLVPRREQIELMRRALAVIQPSLFEGWSTVVEDARVLGRPCLLSDLPVHLEQNPPGARFFPRDSATALAELITEAWTNNRPGPDGEAEAAARVAGGKALANVGTRFLELAGRLCRSGT